MCGICGVHGENDTGRAAATTDRMLSQITHRGPDSGGSFVQPGIAIGMRRLAIIDLAGGDQPIANEDGTVQVVFNGEIYNFRALRVELEARGHRFATRSDTEVLVHGYEEWGDDLPRRVEGMFTFAVWDITRRRLLLARDRFGKKPLYLSEHGGVTRFASEIKSLLAAGVPTDPDPAGVAAFLELRYVPCPGTMFRHVRQLPPGHMMVIDETGSREQRYWHLEYGPKFEGSLEEASARTESLLRDAVAARLVSDVPLGCFLSGGLDSSLVLSFMTELTGGPVEAFSVGFSGGGVPDELPAARSTAAAFGANHHEITLDAAGFLRLMPTAIWHRDEPLAEPSEVPLLELSRLARRHVTVVLSGEGGDELFGGYPKYRADRLVGAMARVGSPILANPLWHGVVRSLPGLSQEHRRLLSALGQPRRESRWPAWFGAHPVTGLNRPRGGALAGRIGGLPAELGALDAMLCLDVESYLADNLLIRGDKMTMAASIEGRMPLLDVHVAEFAARLPESMKTTPRTTKIVLRTIAERRLPAALLSRPKVGFTVPVGAWLRGWLGGAARTLLLDARARDRGLVPPGVAERLLDRHQSGRLDAGKELWSMIGLELWAQIFLDGRSADDVSDELTALGGAADRSSSFSSAA